MVEQDIEWNYEIAHEIWNQIWDAIWTRWKSDQTEKECLENRSIRKESVRWSDRSRIGEPDDPLDELLGFGEVVHELKEINIFFTVESSTRNKVFEP